MKNISFDNPYLLLLIIPLLLFIIVPIIIAIRRENRSKSVFISLGLHILISVCITLALAGLLSRTVMTKTQVYVVADVSYSANRNLNTIDEYIAELQGKLPKNAELGVVVFAKENKVLVEPGSELVSVKDNHGYTHAVISGTDIAAALNDTVERFDEDVIKRIVLITDGKGTAKDAAGELVSAVENVYANDIYLDAIYLDNNLADNAREVQISDVEFAASTYKNREAYATLLIQSNYDTDDVNLDFLVDKVHNSTMSLSLKKGYNIVNFKLPTSYAGRYDYKFSIRAKDQEDSTFNNTYEFSQNVEGTIQVLLVTGDVADVERAKELYGSDAVIDAYVQDPSSKQYNPDVPCTVDILCRYDEIVLSNFDIRGLNNVTAFIDGVDTVVSRFGKSLVTMGDLRIQNKTDTDLSQLEDMLPVKFGNNDQDPKLYTIVIDASRSMQNFSSLIIAKQAAVQLINLLKDTDEVAIVTFWGEIKTILPPTPLNKEEKRAEVIDAINAIKPYQGTVIGTALKTAGDQLIAYRDSFSDLQIMLISDGMSYTLEKDDPVEVVTKLRDYGITTTVIHPTGREEGKATLQGIAEAGGGSYFPIVRESDLMDIMFSEVADDLTDSVINAQTKVNLVRESDKVLEGIRALPDIMGYTYAKAKASATTVLSVDFVKSSGHEIEAPLYSYWNYGNGRVSSFTSTLSGEWIQPWQNEDGGNFFRNMMKTNTPGEHINYPYNINLTYDSFRAELELVPVVLNPAATVHVKLTMPDESVMERDLTFDSARYFTEFDIPSIGRYRVDVTYSYEDRAFTSTSVFHIPYPPEYNSFEIFDPATLHAAVRNRGTVHEGTVPTLVNDDKEIATYTVRYTVPLMIIAVVLYVIDIMIRKLKLHDIKTFFGIRSRKGGKS